LISGFCRFLGAAARGGRFFEKKLRKKLFLGKSFYGSVKLVRTGGHSFLWDGAPQYLPLAKTVLRGAVPYWAHFSLGGIYVVMRGEEDNVVLFSSDFDFSVFRNRRM